MVSSSILCCRAHLGSARRIKHGVDHGNFRLDLNFSRHPRSVKGCWREEPGDGFLPTGVERREVGPGKDAAKDQDSINQTPNQFQSLHVAEILADRVGGVHHVVGNLLLPHRLVHPSMGIVVNQSSRKMASPRNTLVNKIVLRGKQTRAANLFLFSAPNSKPSSF
jgi:hypothetical protein